VPPWSAPYRARAFAVLALAGAGCSVPPLPAATPEVPLEPWEHERAQNPPPAPAEPAFPALPSDATVFAKSAPVAAENKPAPRPAKPSAPIPGGAACLAELSASGVSFTKSDPVLGIATPVVVTGPIGGIQYFTHEKKPMVTDCRLALALFEIAPELRALGVERVRYSSTYVYRTSHPGRMSMHAYGLAIDVHAITFEKATLDVKSAFERGRGAACTAGMKPLNLVSCRIRGRGLFPEQIGPDDNAAHRDHFHLGLKPLPGELAPDLPWPTQVKSRAQSGRARSAR